MKELIQHHLSHTYHQVFSSTKNTHLQQLQLFVQAIWWNRYSQTESNQKLYQSIMNSLEHLLTFMTLLTQLSQMKQSDISFISTMGLPKKNYQDIPESILQLLLLNSVTLFINSLLQISESPLIIQIMKVQTKYIDLILNSTELLAICKPSFLSNSTTNQIDYLYKLLQKQSYSLYLYLYDIVSTIQQYIHQPICPRPIIVSFLSIVMASHTYLLSDSEELPSDYSKTIQECKQLLQKHDCMNHYWKQLLIMFQIDNLQQDKVTYQYKQNPQQTI